MTVIVCQATDCGATNDAPLCRNCTTQLTKALRKLPGLIDALLDTVTRQTRLDETPPLLTRIEDDVAVQHERQIPAALRSRAGRITLPATVLPVSFGAALLHRQAVAGVHSWGRGHSWGGGDTPAAVCRNLRAHIDQFRHTTRAPEVHARAIDLVATIEATIDRRDPDVFAGVCEAIAVDVHWATGVIIPTASHCGAPLLAPVGVDTVQCPKCKTTWQVEERRDAMADKLTEQLGTVREVAGFLRTLELDVTVDKIDGWLRRGRIVDHGTGPRGRLVKVGEVRAYAEQQAERAKARRQERVSA